MGGLFGGAPKPQRNKDQERLIAQQKEEAAQQKSEIEERKASLRKRASGRASLLTGSETGIPSRDTLG